MLHGGLCVDGACSDGSPGQRPAQGHGWWPGRVMDPAADKPVLSSAVSVAFFDDTSGWLQRADCIPFAENFSVLQGRKKSPAFTKAAKARWRCTLPS